MPVLPESIIRRKLQRIDLVRVNEKLKKVDSSIDKDSVIRKVGAEVGSMGKRKM